MVETSNLPTKNFLTRLTELKLESGTTGSARVRRIPLLGVEASGGASTSARGNFPANGQWQMSGAADATLYFWGVITPSDLIQGGFPSVHYFVSNAGTSDSVDWVVKVISMVDEATDDVSLLTDTTSVTVPGVAHTIQEIKISFTLPPPRDSSLHVNITRNGVGDSNNSDSHIWTIWLEYLAHS